MAFADVARRREYHRAYYRPRMALLRSRWRAIGACWSCGQPVTRFTRCNRCRAKSAAQKRRARAGL